MRNRGARASQANRRGGKATAAAAYVWQVGVAASWRNGERRRRCGVMAGGRAVAGGSDGSSSGNGVITGGISSRVMRVAASWRHRSAAINQRSLASR